MQLPPLERDKKGGKKYLSQIRVWVSSKRKGTPGFSVFRPWNLFRKEDKARILFKALKICTNVSNKYVKKTIFNYVYVAEMMTAANAWTSLPPVLYVSCQGLLELWLWWRHRRATTLQSSWKLIQKDKSMDKKYQIPVRKGRGNTLKVL